MVVPTKQNVSVGRGKDRVGKCKIQATSREGQHRVVTDWVESRVKRSIGVVTNGELIPDITRVSSNDNFTIWGDADRIRLDVDKEVMSNTRNERLSRNRGALKGGVEHAIGEDPRD